jgi:hippurate hydrolase
MACAESVRPLLAELTEIRRDIHAHPELGFEEHRTAAVVAGKLREWGLEVHEGIGGTGVVGVLRRGNGQASIGLRCDMDALPMDEATGLPHASANPGRMHGCGHDGHTTMLLGAAKYLAESGGFNGCVNFIFQPAEEGRGGAMAMLKDGLFQRFPCDSVHGMHNKPGVAVGGFAIRPGPAMAGCAFFDLVITGKGSHGARPEASVDPVVVAAHLTAALQSVVARNVPPTDTAVLSVTRIASGDAYNVIPQTAALAGTARAFRRETMGLIEASMRRLATGISAGFGATAELDFRFLFAPVVNDPAETAAMADAAAVVAGEAAVDRRDALNNVSEDFSDLMEQVPGAMIHIGNGASADLHQPNYDFDDEAIPYGVALWATLVERKLPKGNAGS